MYVAVSLAYNQGLYSEFPRQSTSREVTIPGHATFSQQSPLDCFLHWRSRLLLIDQLVFLHHLRSGHGAVDYSAMHVLTKCIRP